MKTIIRALDAVSEWIGRAFSWLILVIVVVTFLNVVLRYAFAIVIIPMYESAAWAFGMVLTGCAGYALLHDDHVRVDVFYRRARPKTKALINLLCSILLLGPFLYVLWNRSFPYVQRSWAMGEGSQELSGIPAVYLLKSFILVFVVVLAIQGIAVALKCLMVLSGRDHASTRDEQQIG